MTLDIAASRNARPYSTRELVQRVLWALVQPAFRLSPRPLFGWRRFLLRLFGARVGAHVHVYPSTRIEMPWNLTVGDWSSIGERVHVYNLGAVTVGQRATVSLGALLCAGSHDHRRANLPLLRPTIQLGDDTWICAEAFIGGGVTVGAGAVVAARAVATRDVPEWAIVAGNPARVVARRELVVD